MVAKFPSEPAASVRETQSALSDPEGACSTAYIGNNFGWLPENVKHLESQDLLCKNL
jgi:hypothetical protein